MRSKRTGLPGILMKSVLRLAPILIILAVILSRGYFLGDAEPGEYRVSHVRDGDTIEVSGIAQSVRYIGIDSPEVGHGMGSDDPLGERATELNSRLVEGSTVTLEFDEERYGVYGRVLAYVYVGEVDVNEEMLRSGLAWTSFIEPNTRHRERYLAAEREAREHRRGLWGPLEDVHYPEGNAGFMIEPSEAGRFMDQRVVTSGTITGSKTNRNVVALKMEGGLDIVIFRFNLPNFEFFGIDPRQDYTHAVVSVIGRVTEYKGKPQIVVDHPVSMRTVH